jgi:hypothetical protein
MSSFDAYIHQTIADNMVGFIKHNIADKSKRRILGEFEATVDGLFTPMDYLAMLVRARPYVQVRKKVEEKLLEKSFQAPNKVANAFQLFGVTRFWPDLANSGKGGSMAKEAPSLLAGLYARRNSIVHEMDRHRSRKNKHQKKHIDMKVCTEALELVDFLVTYIEDTYLDSSKAEFILN